MKQKISQKEIQPLLLSILKTFNGYCKNNDIKLILSGGTMLGSVRHKGFIPWDDDIDVFLSTIDYNKLISLAMQNPYIDNKQRYKILLPAKMPNYYPFIKIVDTHTVVYEKNICKEFCIGLFVDVFCLSYIPNSIEEYKRVLKKHSIYKRFNLILVSEKYNSKYKLISVLFRLLKKILIKLNMNAEYWCNKMIELDKYSKTDYIGNLRWPVGPNDRFHSVIFEKLILSEFEGDNYWIPERYDEYLKKMYGDFMQLPPVEKRIRHDYDAYYL